MIERFPTLEQCTRPSGLPENEFWTGRTAFERSVSCAQSCVSASRWTSCDKAKIGDFFFGVQKKKTDRWVRHRSSTICAAPPTRTGAKIFSRQTEGNACQRPVTEPLTNREMITGNHIRVHNFSRQNNNSALFKHFVHVSNLNVLNLILKKKHFLPSVQGAYPSLIGSTPDDNSNPSDQPVQLHKMKKLNILLRFRIFKKISVDDATLLIGSSRSQKVENRPLHAPRKMFPTSV